MWRGTAISTAYSDIDGWLCPREAFEACLWDDPVWLQEDLDSWRSTLELAAASDDPAHVIRRHGHINLRDPVEGNDWLTWGKWVEQRYVEALEHPGTLHPELRGVCDEGWRLDDPRVPALAAPAVEDAATRWPAAAHGFSRFFGPDTDPQMDASWAQDVMLRSGDEVWRTDLARECGELLLLDDETLRTTVVGLGSVLVPPAFRLRLWLQWMAWRIRTFDWS